MTELGDYVQRLESAVEAERIYAAEDIGFANLAGGVAPLLGRLPAEASRAVREAIIAALQNIEDDAVIVGAIGLLSSEDPFSRNQAVSLLRRRGPGVVPHLARAFPDAGRDERKLLLDVLAGVDAPSASEIYARALADPDPNVVITAVENVGRTQRSEFRERIEELAGSADNPMLAAACLEALAQAGGPHSLEVARRVVREAGPAAGLLRPPYLKMLGALGTGRDVPEAAAMLLSGSKSLQTAVLDALTQIRQRHPEAVLPESLAEPLERAVTDSGDFGLRYRAIRLLAGLARQDGVLAFLSACLALEDPSLRVGAVESLRECGGEQAASILGRHRLVETDAEVLDALGRRENRDD